MKSKASLQTWCVVRSPTEGSATVEVAIVLPAVLAVVGIVLSVLAALGSQLSLNSLAAQAVRDLSRGANQQGVVGAIYESEPDTQTAIRNNEHTVCVELKRATSWPLSLFVDKVSAYECALNNN